MPILKATEPRTLKTTELVSQFVVTWAERSRAKQAGRPLFVLDGTPLNDGDLGSKSGALPLVMWHAENLYRYGIKATGFGATFRRDDEALLQRTVNLDRVYRSTSELLCFALEALEDIRAHLPRCQDVPGAVEVRSLVNQFAEAMGLQAGLGVAPGQPSVAKPQG